MILKALSYKMTGHTCIRDCVTIKQSKFYFVAVDIKKV